MSLDHIKPIQIFQRGLEKFYTWHKISHAGNGYEASMQIYFRNIDEAELLLQYLYSFEIELVKVYFIHDWPQAWLF